MKNEVCKRFFLRAALAMPGFPLYLKCTFEPICVWLGHGMCLEFKNSCSHVQKHKKTPKNSVRVRDQVT